MCQPTVIPQAFKTLTSVLVATISVPEPHDPLQHGVLVAGTGTIGVNLVATGDITEEAFADWLRLHAHKKLVN